MKVTDFRPGDKVRYVPSHANGNLSHPDVENGIVKRCNEHFVFVNYIRNDILQTTAASTKPEDLVNDGQ